MVENSTQPLDQLDQNDQSVSENFAIPRITPMTAAPTSKSFRLKTWHKVAAGVGGVLVALLVILGGLGLYTYGVVKNLQTEAMDLKATGVTAYDDFKAQNLPATKEQLTQVQTKLKAVRATYSKLALYNFLPIAHDYYQDGLHALNAGDAGISAAIKTEASVEPYADVLGFKGQGTFTGGTTEDRLKVLLTTLQKITPELDTIGADLETVKTELAFINENRYPVQVKGMALRSYVQEAHTFSAGAADALTQFKPVFQQLPAIAGATGKKKYLILFQNDKELRPTGGFLTAYSLIYIENGKVTPDKSDDIYTLDKQFAKKLPIPPELGKYLTTEKYWNLRDMNIYPDFKQSMDTFNANYKTVRDSAKDIDGIIAVDTNVLTDLVKVLGPVEVPGFGTFSAQTDPSCDCAQIIGALSQITDRPTPYVRTDRKGILGPMMRNILTKAYTAPKTQWPTLFTTAWQNVQSRHVQFYFFDANAQAAAEVAGSAGRMQLDPSAQDFLAIVDANLGGAKSNLYVSSNVAQTVSAPANGVITKKVVLTYKNDHHGDNCNLEAGLLCLNAAMPDWNRLYLPKGAKLINTVGYRPGTAKQYDLGDFTVVDGEFTLNPLSTAKIEVDYTVPYTDTTTYKVKLWKQGGVNQVGQFMDVNGNQEQFNLIQDMVYQAKF